MYFFFTKEPSAPNLFSAVHSSSLVQGNWFLMLKNNKLHGLSPPGGFASLFFDRFGTLSVFCIVRHLISQSLGVAIFFVYSSIHQFRVPTLNWFIRLQRLWRCSAFQPDWDSSCCRRKPVSAEQSTRNKKKHSKYFKHQKLTWKNSKKALRIPECVFIRLDNGRNV